MEEETGYTAEQWQVICSFIHHLGSVMNFHLILAKGLIKGEARTMKGVYRCGYHPLAEAARMVLSGEIKMANMFRDSGRSALNDYE